jgi:hypothetical protein
MIACDALALIKSPATNFTPGFHRIQFVSATGFCRGMSREFAVTQSATTAR